MQTISIIENYTSTKSNSYVLDCLYSSQYEKTNYHNFTSPIINIAGPQYRIWIDDSIPNYNWSNWVANYSWCSGVGTISNPYIIENMYINAQGVGGALCVTNSKSYFIIRNCWFVNGGSNELDNGISLFGLVGNGTIINNVVNYFHVGIYTFSSSFNTVSNNIMIHDNRVGSRGIKHSWGDDNIYSDNKILNPYDGISFYEADNLVIDGNYIENTERESPWAFNVIRLRNCNNSDITNNTMAGTFANGTISIGQIYSPDNIIINNYVSYDQGLKYDFSQVKLSSGPQMTQGESGTIGLEDCHGNYIAYNVMLLEAVSSDGGIPGYEPFLIITVAGTVIFIILRRRLSH